MEEGNLKPTEIFYTSVLRRESKPIIWNSLYYVFATAGEAHPATNEPGLVKCHFPWSWVSAHIQEFARLALRWAGYVEAAHKSAGLAIISETGGEDSKTGLHDWKLLRDYPRLEYNNAGTYLAKTSFADGTAPRSSNWLTFLGDVNIERLGGRAKIDRLLPPGVEIEDYSGGIMLRAGPKPVFCGPDGPGDVPPLYAAVGKLIKPIRFENYTYGIFNTPEGVNDLDETFRWLRRFD